MIKVNFELQTAFHNSHKPIGKQNNKYSTVVKKDASGKERKYLYATSSGSLYRDAHNEKMTERCIKGFQEQAQTKTIYLLHPHDENILANHIGKLEGDQSFIDENGEWKTVFRFWDDEDLKHDIPSALVARAKDAWNSITGQGVYDGKPSALKQLSIQGLIDENKDIIPATDGSGGRNLDWIELSCVSLVEKGAYPQEDITPVEKVFKQINKTLVAKRETLLGKLIKDENAEEDFKNQLARLEDKFNLKMNEILTDKKLDAAMAKATADNLINEYALEYKKLLGIIQYKLSEDDMALKTKDEAEMSKEEDYAKRKEDSEEMAKEETEVVKDELLNKPLSEMSDEEKAKLLELLAGGETKSKKKEEDEVEKDEDSEEVEKARLEKSRRKIKSIKKEINLIKESIKKSKIKKQEVNPELVGRLADLIDDLNEVSSMLTGTGDITASATKEEDEMKAKEEAETKSKEEDTEEVSKDSEDDAEALGETSDMDDPDSILDVMEKKLGVRLDAVTRKTILQKANTAKLSPAIKSELSSMKSEMAAMRKQLSEAVTINKSLVEAIEEVSGQPIMKAIDVRVNKSLDERLLDELAKNPQLAARISKTENTFGKPQNDFDFIKKSLSPFKGGR